MTLSVKHFGTALLAITVLCAPVAFAATPLRSPWDAVPVALTDGAYVCPALAPLPVNIEASSFYSDSQHSVIDEKKEAAYKAADEHFQEAMATTAKAADAFRATGNRQAAACVLSVLLVYANAHSMTGTMSSNQANYVQNWTMGALAVTWLKVRNANPGSADDRKAVTAWLDAVGAEVRGYFKERHEKATNDGRNNHYYWAGFAAAGAAIAADDRSLYDWGLSTYDDALSRIQPDGTLPLEMDRGQRALHYHLFALAPIIMLAEYGEANGQHTYAQRNGILNMLVKRTLAGLVDNSYFTKAAKAKQDTPDKNEIKSNDVLWAVPYLNRFPDADAKKLIQRASLHGQNYIGGLPPGWPLK